MKLPEPVMWASDKSQSMWGASDESGHPFHIICKGRKVRSHQISLFTEAQLREALARQAAVMRHVLDVLGPQAPECCGCKAEWNEAIKALEEALK